MSLFNQDEEQSVATSTFEIVVAVRNAKGEPTGRTKSFITTSAGELAAWYEKNGVHHKHKKKKTDNKEEQTIDE